MSSDSNQFELGTAHVPFMDIVGYSELHIDEQTRLLAKLQELVRNTKDFRRAESTGELLRLPTGDGMALSFFGDPEAPIRCAAEISIALRHIHDEFGATYLAAVTRGNPLFVTLVLRFDASPSP